MSQVNGLISAEEACNPQVARTLFFGYQSASFSSYLTLPNRLMNKSIMVAGPEVIQRLSITDSLTKASLTMATNEGPICQQQDRQYGSIPQSDQFSSVSQSELCNLTLCLTL